MEVHTLSRLCETGKSRFVLGTVKRQEREKGDCERTRGESHTESFRLAFTGFVRERSVCVVCVIGQKLSGETAYSEFYSNWELEAAAAAEHAKQWGKRGMQAVGEATAGEHGITRRTAGKQRNQATRVFCWKSSPTTRIMQLAAVEESIGVARCSFVWKECLGREGVG